MGPNGGVVVHRPKSRKFNSHYAQSTLTYDRESIMAWKAFSWHDAGPIVKIHEKNVPLSVFRHSKEQN